MTAYFNGYFFTGSETLHGPCLLTENGRILGFSETLPPEAEKVDLQNGWLVPAFLDLQIYGGHGQFFGEFPSVEALSATYDYCLSGGASHFMPTLATHSEAVTLAAIAAVRDYWQQGRPGVLGLHLEGPFIHPAKRGAHLPQYVRTPDLDSVRKLFDQGRGVVKMMTIAPEICPPEVLDFFMQQREVVISAGHSNATYRQAQAAFDGGIRTATHIFNAMSALQHREPGLVGAIFNHPTVRVSLVADGYHVDFAAIRVAKKMLQERLFLITDAVTENPHGQYAHRRDGDKYVVADGTLSGSALTMLQAVKNCVYQAGMPLEEALRMASLYPAQVMGLEGEFGKIAVGRKVDFLWLNPGLELVERFANE